MEWANTPYMVTKMRTLKVSRSKLINDDSSEERRGKDVGQDPLGLDYVGLSTLDDPQLLPGARVFIQ